MADDVTLTGATGTYVTATDEIGGKHHQRVKVGFGPDGTATDVSAANPLPVAIQGALGSVSVSNFPASQPVIGTFWQATQPISGTVSVSNFPVSQPVTGTFWQATQPVSIAAPVSVTGTFFQATQPVSIAATVNVAGPLTDAQLRATPVVISPEATLEVAITGGVEALATDATLGAVNAKLTASTGIPDNLASGLNVRPIGQDTWSCSFSDSGASVLSADFVTPIVGTNVTYNQTSGALNIVAGTTANSEFLARSIKNWRGVLALRYSMVASQRIASNNMAIILADHLGSGLACTINSATSITVTDPAHGLTASNVGQFMFVGGIVGAAGVPGRYAIAAVPTANTITLTVAGWPASGSCTVTLFGHTHVKHLYTSTVATNVSVDSQRKGWASGDTVATINTTAGVGHIMQAHLAGRELYWSDMLRVSTLTPAATVRASRYESLPDDNLDLHLFLWSYNGVTNPATSTTWTISFIGVEKFVNLPVYIQGQELQGFASPAPVAVTNAITASISGTATVTPAVPTEYTLNSLATTNAGVIKASAGQIHSVWASNEGAAAAYVKLYNLAASPTVGTSIPAITIAIPAMGTVSLDIGSVGQRFGTGIAIATTNLMPQADATAVAAGQVKVKLTYI